MNTEKLKSYECKFKVTMNICVDLQGENIKEMLSGVDEEAILRSRHLPSIKTYECIQITQVSED